MNIFLLGFIPYQEENFIIINDCLDSAYEALEIIEEHIENLERLPLGMPYEGRISSFFGIRSIPYTKGSQFHTGIDIIGDKGDEIIATGKGKVIFASRKNSYGKLIIIDHGNNYKTYYAHLSTILVNLNQEVEKGDIIGKIGRTGRATGVHLHYEIRYNSKPINPIKYIR